MIWGGKSSSSSSSSVEAVAVQAKRDLVRAPARRAARGICQALTAGGHRCPTPSKPGSMFCAVHMRQQNSEKGRKERLESMRSIMDKSQLAWADRARARQAARHRESDSSMEAALLQSKELADKMAGKLRESRRLIASRLSIHQLKAVETEGLGHCQFISVVNSGGLNMNRF